MFESTKSFASLLAFFERSSGLEDIGNPSASSTMESQGVRNSSTGQSWGQRAEMNSLQRRLNEMTTRAVNAERELIAEKKVRFYVQFERDEYEAKYERVRSMIGEAREVQKELRTRNTSVNETAHALESENEELRAEKNSMKAKAFEAHHEADMMGLLATQLGLQAKSLDRQLKESKRSVKALTERVEQLEQAQWENAVKTSRSDRENDAFGVEREGLPDNGSRVMGTHGIANTGGAPDVRMRGRANGEGDQDRDGVDGQAGLLRRLTLRFQRSTTREDAHTTAEVRWQGSKMARKLRSIVRPGSDDTGAIEGLRDGVLRKGSRMLAARSLTITNPKPDLSMRGRRNGEGGQGECKGRSRLGLLHKMSLRYQRSTVECAHATKQARWQVPMVFRKLRSIARPRSHNTEGNEDE